MAKSLITKKWLEVYRKKSQLWKIFWSELLLLLKHQLLKIQFWSLLPKWLTSIKMWSFDRLKHWHHIIISQTLTLLNHIIYQSQHIQNQDQHRFLTHFHLKLMRSWKKLNEKGNKSTKKLKSQKKKSSLVTLAFVTQIRSSWTEFEMKWWWILKRNGTFKTQSEKSKILRSQTKSKSWPLLMKWRTLLSKRNKSHNQKFIQLNNVMRSKVRSADWLMKSFRK